MPEGHPTRHDRYSPPTSRVTLLIATLPQFGRSDGVGISIGRSSRLSAGIARIATRGSSRSHMMMNGKEAKSEGQIPKCGFNRSMQHIR
ncbi:hypothetical protein QTH97_30335 [Variovorax sp. J22R24]|uniref:hypothetical protein n=1 Tax=Variovorax gracilis TaxID=3053502 RepID=UPI0025784A7D|nr:hypothetical protein [Variovorax sp. J22R24]MDM0109271.1 hypothetical protein [Variovorax sp. J22R24]